jgi:hypothetical protein
MFNLNTRKRGFMLNKHAPKNSSYGDDSHKVYIPCIWTLRTMVMHFRVYRYCQLKHKKQNLVTGNTSRCQF